MALFGILGYLYGLTAAIITLIFILLGLGVFAGLGTTLINIINRTWQLIASGGLQTFFSGGDLSQVKEQMATVPPLISNDAAAAFLVLIMIILIVLAILLGMHPRFRRPPSLLALLIGLLNGYLIGAFLLRTMVPALSAFLPVPFFPAPAPTPGGVPAVCCTSLWSQFVAAINNASTQSLALLVMFVIAAIVLTALFLTLRRRGGRRGAARDRD